MSCSLAVASWRDPLPVESWSSPVTLIEFIDIDSGRVQLAAFN